MTFNYHWLDEKASREEIIQTINMNMVAINQCLQELDARLDNVSRYANDHQHGCYVRREDIDDLHAHMKYFCNDLLREEGYIIGKWPENPNEPQFF